MNISTAHSDYLLELSDATRRDIQRIGVKAANLGELASAGFPVPEGLVGALVTDTGGILSHSAIIAREYRVPTVVATGNATRLLRDGENVTVDGTTGIVEIRS